MALKIGQNGKHGDSKIKSSSVGDLNGKMGSASFAKSGVR